MTDHLQFDGRTYTLFGFQFAREIVDESPWIRRLMMLSQSRDEFVASFPRAAWIHSGVIARVAQSGNTFELLTSLAWRHVGEDIRRDVLDAADRQDINLADHLWERSKGPDWTPNGIAAGLRHLADILEGVKP